MANIPISSFTAAANATGIGMSGFSLTGTNAQSMLDLAGTWNTTGTPTGIKLNVTDTTSNAASLLADLQVGGTSRFNVTKAGGGYFAGNVGIGTTNANARLVVSDSAAIATLRVDTSNAGVSPSNYSEIVLSDINSPRAWWRNVRDGSGQTGFGYNNHLAFFSAAGSTPVERVRFDSSGNVGIGTNSPGTPLDVIGTTRSGNFRVNAGGSVTGAGMWGIDTILAFNTGSLERMRIDSSGNTGIGTATPSARLDISGGDIRLSTNATYIRSTTSGGTSVRMLGLNVSDTAYIGPIDNGPTGAVFNASSTVTTASFYTSGVERLTINSTGNVGIGTTAPTAKLSVGDAAAAKLNLLIGTAERAYIDYTEATTLMRIDSDAAMALNTNNAERIRINSAGDVGIGTTSPANRFVVSNGGANGFEFDAAAGIIQTYNRGTSAYTDTLHYGLVHRFFTGASPTEKMRIDASGNVLVGKTAAGVGTDGAQLIAAGFSGFSAPGTTALFLNRNTSDGTILEFGRNGVSAATMGLTSSALTVSTAGTERMRIESTGAVVLPKLTLSTDTPFVTGANINSGANSLAMGGSGTGVVSSFTNNTERMRVKANGQVRFIPLAAAPAGPEAGDVYYDSTTNKLRCYNGTTWNDLF